MLPTHGMFHKDIYFLYVFVYFFATMICSQKDFTMTF